MNDHQRGLQQPSANSRQQHAAAPTKPDRRTERLQELYQSALDLPDPRQFAVRYATAELLDVSSILAEAIHDEYRGQKQSLREMRKSVLPAIGNLNALHRQVTRYSKLDLELEARESVMPSELLPPPLQLNTGDT